MFRLYLVSHPQAYAVTKTIKLGSVMADGIALAYLIDKTSILFKPG
jgi:hypothetical protein